MFQFVRYTGKLSYMITAGLAAVLTILREVQPTLSRLIQGNIQQIGGAEWLLILIFILALGAFFYYVTTLMKEEGLISRNETRLRGALIDKGVKWVGELKGRNIKQNGKYCVECGTELEETEVPIGELYGDEIDVWRGGTIGAEGGRWSGDLLNETETALVCPTCGSSIPAFDVGESAWKRVQKQFHNHFQKADHDFEAPNEAWNEYIQSKKDDSLKPLNESLVGEA